MGHFSKGARNHFGWKIKGRSEDLGQFHTSGVVRGEPYLGMVVSLAPPGMQVDAIIHHGQNLLGIGMGDPTGQGSRLSAGKASVVFLAVGKSAETRDEPEDIHARDNVRVSPVNAKKIPWKHSPEGPDPIDLIPMQSRL